MRQRNWPRGWPLRLLTIAAATAVWLAGTGPVQAAPPTPQDDIAPLRRMIGDARIVGLGESTHGAHEEFTLKLR